MAQKVENRQVLTNVPPDRVEKVIAMFNAEGAESVTTKKAADGTYTVEATFPSKGVA